MKNKTKKIVAAVAIGGAALIGMANCSADNDAQTAASTGPAPTVSSSSSLTQMTPAEPAAPAVPREYDRALQSAESYLDFAAFSKTGLADQLRFEKYSEEAVAYAVENVDADWLEQAVKSAESYLEFSSFSRPELVGQLEFEGFTPEQAERGVSVAY